MKQYTVTNAPINFGIGAILELTKKQADCRQHLLEKVQGNKYKALKPVQFKCGEVVGLEGDPDKSMAARLVLVETKKESGKT